MKKRTKKAIALALTVCMILAMTTTFASAASHNNSIKVGGYGVADANDKSMEFGPGTEITSEADELNVVFYDDYYGELVLQSYTYSKSDFGDGIIKVTIPTFGNNVAGYKDECWEIAGHGWGSDESGKIDEFVDFKRVSLEYPVEYYNGDEYLETDWLLVDSDRYFLDYCHKEGYVLKGWDTNPEGKTVVHEPGAEVEYTFLINLSTTDPYKLYAVWEKAPAAANPDSPSHDTTELDDSAKTGDSTPAIALAFLMALSALGAVATLRKSI